MKTPKTQVTVIETDYNKHEMHSTIQYRADSTLKTIQIIKLTQNRNTIMITMKFSNLKAKTTRPIHSNLTPKKKKTMIETPRNPILKTTHKFKKIILKTRNM